MNAIVQALKASGVAIPPLKERIFLWLKDHPEKTATEISNALNLGYSIASTVTNGNDVCLITSAATPLAGVVTYVQQ